MQNATWRTYWTAALVCATLMWCGTVQAGAPANDNFANAQALPATSFKITGSTVGASHEPGEPNHAGALGVASVWFSWTAPANMMAGFSLFGSSFDTSIGVYTGTAVNTLVKIVDNDDTFPPNTSYAEFAAVSGTQYVIAVDGFDTGAGNFVLTFAPAPNDSFANRIALSGSTFFVREVNKLATKEAGEPNHGGNVGGKSLWYKWTAPAAGRFAVTTLHPDAGTDTLLAVYTGTAVNALALVGENDDASARMQSLVEFTAVAGTEYQIAVDSKGASDGAFFLTLLPAPANDNFAAATVLSGASAPASGYTFGASKETGEPDHAANAGGHSVWFTWTAPVSGNAGVSTSGSNFDTLLAVYTGSAVNALTMVVQNDDDMSGFLSSSLVFAATAGTTYSIALDGKAGAVGNYALQLSMTPPNDNFVNAIALNGDTNSVNGDNLAATKEAGEPDHNSNLGGHSVWYNWTPATSGRGRLGLADSGVLLAVGVYSGDSVNALTRLFSAGGSTTFPVMSGVTYRIAIDTDVGSVGTFALSTSVDPTEVGPANDDFANAQPLTGLIATFTGDNTLATQELGEPRHAGQTGGGSVWFSFAATQTRTMALSTAGSEINTLLAVYTGSAVSSLTPVAFNNDAKADGSSALTFPAVAGTTYWIAIDGLGGFDGAYTITLNPATLSFPSGLAISSNPAVVGQGLTFTALTDATAIFVFDFGDGVKTTTTDNTVTHSYAAAGTYNVSVTATAPLGATATAGASLIVRPVFNLLVQKTSIKLNFAKPNSDSLSVSGFLFVPNGLNLANKSITVNIGGIVKTFTTDAKGNFKSGGDAAKFTFKQIAGGGNAKFTLTFGKQALAATLAPLGFSNATVANQVIQLPIEIVFNDTSYRINQTLFYKATMGKSGAAK